MIHSFANNDYNYHIHDDGNDADNDNVEESGKRGSPEEKRKRVVYG